MLVVTIRSFSEKFLDFSLDQIKKVLVKKDSIDLYNITRLPKSFKKVTVVRSPHVNKQSKEKFSYTLHTIQLKLKVKDNLNSIELIKKILPPQVSLTFKLECHNLIQLHSYLKYFGLLLYSLRSIWLLLEVFYQVLLV